MYKHTTHVQTHLLEDDCTEEDGDKHTQHSQYADQNQRHGKACSSRL